jgi:pimeloyl-ACP methyl ester carboxylesterase
MSTDITTTISLAAAGLGEVPLTFSDQGDGQVFLLLHGGGGPLTVDGFAARLAATEPGARVITPIHPGFSGTPRPEALNDIRGLARLYVDLLESVGVDQVTVVGNSIGGWVAAEMAVLGSPRVSGYVIVNGVGIEVPGHPVVDFFSLTPAEVARRSYHDPERFGIDPSALPPEALRVMQANRATLTVYGGDGMGDPTLSARLGNVKAPAIVLWGEADRIADPDYGRAFADAIPGARFQLISASGHLPQIEAPEALLEALTNFAAKTAGQV